MLFSIYPSDTADVREAVVAQALASGGGTVFTSLHIPETSGLERFGDYLADLHRRHGLTFCADVSPGTLGQLSCDIDDLGRLRGWGVDTVRIDFGFDADETRRVRSVFTVLVVGIILWGVAGLVLASVREHTD